MLPSQAKQSQVRGGARSSGLDPVRVLHQVRRPEADVRNFPSPLRLSPVLLAVLLAFSASASAGPDAWEGGMTSWAAKRPVGRDSAPLRGRARGTSVR